MRNLPLLGQALETLLKLLAPFTPHITEELWVRLEGKPSVHLQSWPEYDPEALKVDTVTLAVQINGKVRHHAEVSVDATKEEIQAQVLGLSRIQELVGGKKVVKVIVVPQKLINIVIR